MTADRRCTTCGIPVVPNRWTVPPGARRYGGHGQCGACRDKARRRARPRTPRTPRTRTNWPMWRRTTVVDDVLTLRHRTDDPQAIADALGITPGGVAASLARAGRTDLARPFWQAQRRIREARA